MSTPVLKCDGATLTVEDWNKARTEVETLIDEWPDMTSIKMAAKLKEIAILLKCQ